MGIGRAAALGLMLGLAAPAGAATLDYTSFHVLGDSLSDVGNVYRTTLGTIPESPPYWRGRFSNGPVWADRVADRFRDAGLPTGNHAWGGSNAIVGGLDVPGLAAQGARYRSLDDDRVGNRPLVAIWTGGNDILDMAGGDRVRRKARRSAERVGDVASALRRSGTRDFVILNLPDIGAIPKFGDDPADGRSASRATRAFNRELDAQIAALRDDGARVRKVNVHALFDDLLEHPRRYGVRNTTTPCLDEDGDACSDRQARRRAFFDEIHPNRVVHRRVAEAVMARIEPSARSAAAAPVAAAVPLPPAAAMLLAGMLALAATSAAGAARARRREG
jgi:outer membrane lipase/esterase